MVSITINDTPCDAAEGATVLSAARANGIYIPTICDHPDFPPFHDLPLAPRVFRGHTGYENHPVDESGLRTMEGCGLCVVEVGGCLEAVRACRTPVESGMSLRTQSDSLKELRRTRLATILACHPHACLTCAQREGCSLEDCSSNVPVEERCCSKFHNCELRKVTEFVGVKEDTARYRPGGLVKLNDEPLFARHFSLCIDCARCVRICNEVRGVGALGIVHHDGRLVVGSVAPTLTASGCKFCGACVEVCPTGCLTDKGSPTGSREKWLVPCVQTCPAGVDVPGYIRRIAAGDFKGAAARIWEQLPLANVLGYICFHQCECECRRGRVDDPIAICALKRFALEMGGGDVLADAVAAAPSGKKVGVVGAGPGGLGAAYFLRFMGHGVTVFEAAESPGGMPALSVPMYRLPQDVLDKDLAVIRDLGVEIKTGHHVATGDALRDLLDRGFDAVLVAGGLPESKKIAVEGADLNGVLWGLDFLRRAKAGATFELGEDIVVVGGGNVAIDVAMTALRISGARVRLFCLECREEMPAHTTEAEKAQREGIEINPRWGPAAIDGDQGKVTGVEFRRCTAVFDDQRKFAPTFDEKERTRVNADTVILAVGQARSGDLSTEQHGVFLAGDIVGGSMGGGSVVHAVASGRAAAERIDRYLGGRGEVNLKLCDHTLPPRWIGRDEGFAPSERVNPPCAAPEERCTDFRVIEGTYALKGATAEARRCLQCDLRLGIAQPSLPPEKWVDFDRPNVERVPTVEGVFILADAGKKPTAIKGTENLRAVLLEKLESPGGALFFAWEQDRMYSQRESELIQQHLARYGEMPAADNDELDELF